MDKLTTVQAAHFLRIRRDSVRDLVKSGRIKCTTMPLPDGRYMRLFDAEELRAYRVSQINQLRAKANELEESIS